MNYNIKGTQLDISDELRTYAERKLAAADKFLIGDPTAHANIELQHLPLGLCTVPSAGGQRCTRRSMPSARSLRRSSRAIRRKSSRCCAARRSRSKSI